MIRIDIRNEKDGTNIQKLLFSIGYTWKFHGTNILSGLQYIYIIGQGKKLIEFDNGTAYTNGSIKDVIELLSVKELRESVAAIENSISSLETKLKQAKTHLNLVLACTYTGDL